MGGRIKWTEPNGQKNEETPPSTFLLTPGWSCGSLCQSSHERIGTRARERGSKLARRWAKYVENRKKILNSGNELKNVLQTNDLAFSGAKNELVFECKKGQSNPKICPGIHNLGGRRATFGRHMTGVGRAVTGEDPMSESRRQKSGSGGGTQKATPPGYNYKSAGALRTGAFHPSSISVPPMAEKGKRPGVRRCGWLLNVRLYLRSVRLDCFLLSAFCLLLSAYCLHLTKGGLDSHERFV